MTATGILYDLRGFLGVSELSPEKWRKYFEVSSLEENHPGSYSIAYVEMVRKENISVFEELMRNSGDSKYLNYMVFPKTGEDISYPPVVLDHCKVPLVAFKAYTFLSQLPK